MSVVHTHTYLGSKAAHSIWFRKQERQTLMGENEMSDLAALFFMHSTRVLGPRGDKGN